MRFLGFFADVLSEPDAEWGPTWEVKCACVFVRLWVHSPAALFCTDHINDTTEAWAVDCSLKAERRTKCEMEEEAGWRGVWGGRKREPELKSSETKQVTVREKGEKKKKKKKKEEEKKKRNRKTKWTSTWRATLLLPLTTSTRTLFLLPPFFCSPLLISLWFSLGPGLVPPPSHYHSSSGRLAVDAAVNLHVLPARHLPPPNVHLCSSAELVWSRLLPYTGKVVGPFPERWWTEEGRKWRAEDRRREHMVS